MVEADRGDDRDGRVDDVGGIPASAHADFDDRDVDGGVGERGERHGGDDLELAHLGSPGSLGLRVDEFDERFELPVDLDVLSGRDGLAVDRDALHGRLQVRARGASGAAVQRRQQCVDHARDGGLAVGAGHVDARVAPLRRAEKLEQCTDAGGARVEFRFGPTLVEQVLDLQQRRHLIRSGCRHDGPRYRRIMRGRRAGR